MAFSIVILAAGKGKRMQSSLPKVLHQVGGKSLLEHVVQTAITLTPQTPPIVVCGQQSDLLKMHLAAYKLLWVEQTEQLGTAHAVLHALALIPDADKVLILSGDVPLISVSTLQNFLSATPADNLGLITATLAEPTGFGRIVRDECGQIVKIVEERDARADEKAIQEINTGIYCIAAKYLKKWLPKIKNDNAQKEFYLTDIVSEAKLMNIPIFSLQPAFNEEISGVNDRLQLNYLERFYQQKQAENFMRLGVTFADPARFDARGEVTIGRDTVIDINVVLEGKVSIGNNCYIGPGVIIKNSILSNHVEIRAYSHLDGAQIAQYATAGPFARLRPGTTLAEHCHIGNFVEIKNCQIASKTKINHLSYMGDAVIGRDVNIGAGTITCNYDGVSKHKTIIEDGAFIGSDTQLIAPVTIGSGATIGAGSTITRDAPAQKLTLCRGQQRTLENWQRPNKKEKI
jgi:bifunctional UDP-N-acetylglucosamine pyrophosphorylase/glucosamine-1-phosphate N-acetyltransferase